LIHSHLGGGESRRRKDEAETGEKLFSWKRNDNGSRKGGYEAEGTCIFHLILQLSWGLIRETIEWGKRTEGGRQGLLQVIEPSRPWQKDRTDPKAREYRGRKPGCCNGEGAWGKEGFGKRGEIRKRKGERIEDA